MIRSLLAFAILLCVTCYCQAGIIRGRITNERGEALPFATLFIKGTTQGTTTNADGQYHLELPDGAYTVVCQYIGYRKTEKSVTLAGTLQLDFQLQPVSMQIREVIVKGNGEDPAYAIIRQAIKKRPFYQQQVQEFTCNTYIKGMFKLRNVPERFLGQKVDKQDIGVDSTGRGIVFLSESLTKLSVKRPDKVKLQVLSSRQSGGGFGFSFPAYINFYDNNVSAVITQFSPRGYISPIADNALAYYKYHLEGVFTEDGYTVNKIQVIPKRKFEPLFSGYIFITDDNWRIHSANLLLTRDYQLELMDTLQIRQTHVPVDSAVWRMKDQLITISLKQFGFDMIGNFVNVYSNYDIHPNFPPKYFNNVLMKYDTAFNDKKIAYWDSIRPVPLEKEEVKDFHEKDSAAQARRDSAVSAHHLDSLRKHQPPVKLQQFFWGGVKHNYYFRRDSALPYHQLAMRPLLTQLEYNTVEGLVLSVEPSLTLDLPKDQELKIAPFLRYGFSNTHLNGYTEITWDQESRLNHRYGSNTWKAAGGKRVSQFNKQEPIDPLTNEVYTLLLKENYMKLYENWFGSFSFRRNFESNAAVDVGFLYEDRIPLENTTDFVVFKNSSKAFLPNHPYELADVPFVRHQALIMNLNFSFQPGQRYIELPDRKVAIGAKYPRFEVGYTKGIHGWAGSDVDYDKWNAQVSDNMNFKLFGELRYRLAAGGFLNSKEVGIPDYTHFNGNQTFYNIRYLNSFQLAPYYKYSNIASFYTTLNLEHHFNGLLTNKIPLLNRLKWNLVAGANAFYINSDNNYVEVFAGLENIFKLIRVDVIAGYQSKDATRIGVRAGFGGLLGGALFRRR
ncbi:CarboxypepD_reg-like domain-containing protein [Chitinophaga rupis]|uniref:CarboxypepD_reg-like domain-containing protein n=1 Tax=Chitinophaga rupis TaxID=573321 RepID=A0A1H7TB11_9BACT|nr:DUF5686 and carboxypeptidase regulatory-like domain-containing protein [Chitinophaga rupis]SEL81913.1 CarboxypepD_reg-like domain-containing protein [Chitinophaga rupis]